jgi:hypothetical protein
MKKLILVIMLISLIGYAYSNGNKEVMVSFGAEHDFISELGSDFITKGSGSAGIYYNYARFNEGKDIGTAVYTHYLVPYGNTIEDPGTGEIYQTSWADFRLSIGMSIGPIARWKLSPDTTLFISLGPSFRQSSFVTAEELSNDVFLSYIFGGVAATGMTFKIENGGHIDTGVKAEYMFADYTQSGFADYACSNDYNHISVRAYVGLGISKTLTYVD